MNKQPKLLNFSKMHEILEPHLTKIRESIFFNPEMGIIHGNSQLFRLIIQQEPPFAIDDYRFGVVVQGHARINFNLVEKQIESHTIVFLGPGTVITPLSYSDDLEIFGMALFADFTMPFPSGQMPSAFNGQVRDFQLHVDNEEFETVCEIINTLWKVVQQHNINKQTANSLVAALMHYYDDIYHRHTNAQQSIMSREQNLFNRFIYLVNQYAVHEHQIGFYADKMCLTERYLGTIIRQISGTTAKEWIDRAIITHIKIELKHSEKSIAQISDDMNFPNPSFFTKYFHRLTGSTPKKYRQKDR